MAIIKEKVFNKIFCIATRIIVKFLMLFQKQHFYLSNLFKVKATNAHTVNQTRFQSIQTEAHPFCMVCSRSNPLGLGLKFVCEEDGSVSTTFTGHPALEGFKGVLHGGVIASLLDGAMTNCLFAHGCAAMTGELNVRYREPVVIGEEMLIRAWIKRFLSPLHLVAAELNQGNRVKAAGTAKFVERPGTAQPASRF